MHVAIFLQCQKNLVLGIEKGEWGLEILTNMCGSQNLSRRVHHHFNVAIRFNCYQKKINKSIWRWRQPCLEPCASVLPPYCTVNKLGLRERPGRRDSKAAEIGRPWGTEGPEGADHPSVVVWPPGVPDGDQNHPHDPAVSRTETLSSTPTHSRIRHSGKRQLRGRRRKERDIIGKFTHVAPCVPSLRPTFCLASFWVLCHGVNTNDPPSTKMINTPHIF
jgi:hypothetical protein